MMKRRVPVQMADEVPEDSNSPGRTADEVPVGSGGLRCR